ncbi:ATP-binding protein [Blautia sp.]|uniref:ATP-binding protein n=1 Tax=Blautia sp. TaxID=1955243 RepID=UPI003FA42EBF
MEDLETDCLPEDLWNKLPELSTLDFIKNHQNIIMTGNPGIGKTHTAIGLGMKACEEGYRVLFVRIPDLLTELKESNDAKKLLIVYPSGQQKSQRS